MRKLGVLLLAAALTFGGLHLAKADTVGIGNGNELSYFGIPQLTALAGSALDPSADYIPVYDASTQTTEKMLAPLPRSPVTVTATGSLTEAANAGHVNVLSSASAVALTLPAATGTGDVYKFFVGTVDTSGYSVAAAGSDKLTGGIHFQSSTAGSDYMSTTGTTLTINGTTKGGSAVGDWFEMQDVKSGVWAVKGAVTPTGVYATPFS